MELVKERDRTEATGASSFWRRAVLGRLDAFRGGEIEIVDSAGATRAGRAGSDDPRARLVVHDDRFWRRLALGGSLGAAESYVDGDWDADDLTAAVRVFARNLEVADRVDGGATRLLAAGTRIAHFLAKNTRRGARRNIAAHYDLGNEFFERMLDDTLTYSCGLFERGDSTLRDASLAKIDRLCQKLALRPGDHLLEIGTGWGALAIRAAEKFGCRVTTTTLSARQREVAVRRVAEAGLSDRVEVLLTDYRDLRGTYSKLVSVEMIEAVGAEFYETFFRACAERLAPDGAFAMQAITIADRRFEQARRDVDFIKRHIFPGSCIPSITALVSAATRASDFGLVALEDLTPHYPRTLAAWRANLERNRDAVAGITSERFRRLWHFYLCYCEGGFLERAIGVVQMTFARPRWRG